MKSISLRFRPVFLAALFIVGFATVTAPKQADAQQTGKAGHEFDYYSDATHAHRVGVMIVCSDGRVFRSGQITGFVVIGPSGC